MNKQAFLANQDIEDFLDWLARELPRLKIRLDIKRSRFVPSALRVDAFEASLLMVGYDRGCLDCTRRGQPHHDYKKPCLPRS